MSFRRPHPSTSAIYESLQLMERCMRNNNGDDPCSPPVPKQMMFQETRNKLQWLSRHIETLYSTFDGNLCTTIQHATRTIYASQINDIIAALVLTEMNDSGLAKYMNKKAASQISSALNTLLCDLYGKQAVKYVLKCYSQPDIYNMHKEWERHNASCREINTILCNAKEKELKRICGISVQPNDSVLLYSSSVCSCLDGTELTDLFSTERNKTMDRTDILDALHWTITEGYIRHNAGDLDIPQCISQFISICYVPKSLRCKILRLFEIEIYQLRVCDMSSLFESLDGLARIFPMIQDSKVVIHTKIHSHIKSQSDRRNSFYIVYRKNIFKILGRMSDAWNNRYLSGEIGITEYTKKIETLMQKAQMYNCTLDRICVDILIPSYIQCILDKNGGDYNTLAATLHTSELQRIYNIFVKKNSAEAKRLNDAYKQFKSRER